MMTGTQGPRREQPNAEVNMAGPGEQQPDQTTAHLRCFGWRPAVPFRQRLFQLVFSTGLNCISILIILINCIIQGNFQPCIEDHLLQDILVCFVFVYFLVEMLIKVTALGLTVYLQHNWHKFDVFILCGELLDFSLKALGFHMEICYVLTPLRLFSRVDEMRKLVSMLLGILPMLGNVLILYAFVVYIFGLVGVQLWAGDLRYRCFLGEDIATLYNRSLSPYYVSLPGERAPFICSVEKTGMRHCWDIPPLHENGNTCLLAAPQQNPTGPLGANVSGCVNWNAYYNVCLSDGQNPNLGSINFDNIGYAWIAVFQAVSLEGWTDIMYYVMDSYSYWSCIYFIILTILGSFIVMNTCAVVIATHYSEATEDDAGEPLPGTLSLNMVWTTLRNWLVQLYSSLCNKWSSSDSRSSATPSKPFQKKLEVIVTGQIFNRVIMAAIFLNILCMAVEHHNQPLLMTMALQICNTVFAALFVLEMILKQLAFRWAYFEDWSNVFDFAIVIISLWELGAQSDSKLSVIRAFRALRLGKLVHFLPYLQRQLLVLKRTMVEAAMLCWLLFFGIYLFGILGMHLFGCKIESSGPDFSSNIDDMVDNRKNFDTLLWSMVTVFQVLTQEDWNFVLYNTMASISAWATVYFVAVIILGKNVLLNILVGIVVESFQNQPEEVFPPPESGSATLNPDDPSGTSLGPSNSESSSGQMQSIQVEEAAVTQMDQDHGSMGWMRKMQRWCKDHEDWSLYLLSPQNWWRRFCTKVVSHKNFDMIIQIFIMINCVTIAWERPSIQPDSMERRHLDLISHVLSVIFLLEMLIKISALGLVFGKGSYCHSLWNIIDGLLVITSLADICVELMSSGTNSSLDILKILRLLRTFRPLRMVKRTPKLKLAVEALLASVKPMGNIILICGIFIFFYSLLGLQLFKGKFFHCVGGNITRVLNKSDCLDANYQWVKKEYNFDNLIQAAISVFVMYSKDGWVNLMYDGLDAVGVDQQPQPNYNLWMLLYFISFILMSFLLLDMFIGVMVDTFHKCQREQRTVKEIETDTESEHEEVTYFLNYSWLRLKILNLCRNESMECFITAIIIVSLLLMGVEHYEQPESVRQFLEWVFYVITFVLVLEVVLKIIAFGLVRFLKVGWNVLDVFIVLISVISVVLSQFKISDNMPIKPSIFRVMRVLRLAQVLKTTKMKVLLKTITRTLYQVGNLGLLFMFFFLIYAALGVELFGKLECSEDFPCLGLHRHTNFENFGVALLTLYKVSTGDNWSGILKDTMRECRVGDSNCPSYLFWASPIFFTTFVITVQFVLVNLVVAAIMQALEDSTEEVKNDRLRLVPPVIVQHQPIQVNSEESG
ncbi:voltage-dependent T-type calcium channel subunit alpha-1I-like isoform X2 [Fundulus heteroclitus]|uniref:voltage-dependent T-type calcium channel subunit alpha-1I-like isoform X2 n=1 Tax=Fundulus heteroclitus TaxID=8078 RepID=UPI00165BC7C0|nr:voltage-dependent T-type calcium channel subunit alpha-1I-like isoform X2 [Fundulus heteroclitus]